MSTMPGPNGREGGRRGGRGRPPTHHRPEPRPPASSPAPPVHVHGEAPRPPRELAPDPDETRTFDADGESWTARVAGKGAWGSGAYGLGMVVAVHFARAEAPDQPLREALLPRGRFVGLFDEELRALLASATPITAVPPSNRGPEPRDTRRRRDW